ncbi:MULTISPECIES: FecCD family ABC transporter permease [Rothia]|uniref:Enterobactin ABC transporter permease n=1 Tax=Rothia nasimurium TaxID=85336 RepID=A0A1Y1RLN7_9MICC|nr:MULTISPECIES: iron chelate uptake ABC transporter family permease subunit [Rothia]ORC15263.1 enterobactin ABC transporter permease [Rothia nasimurium]
MRSLTRRARAKLATGCAIALLLLATWLDLTTGTYSLSLPQIAETLAGQGSDLDSHILLNQRLPRLVAATIVGAALGLAGMIFQSVSRNPLGSPDIIGFTTGSATGALTIMLVVPTASSGSPGIGVAAGALIGGFLTAILALILARFGSRGLANQLILVGIALGAMLASVNDYLLTRADLEAAEVARTWQYGSLNALTWSQTGLLAVLLALTLLLALLATPSVRLLELGDDLAAALGLHVTRTSYILLTYAVLLTAGSIALGGPIGFIALVAPQLARRIWNTPGAALWQSPLLGAVLLAWADYFAGHLFAPVQLPVGLVTGALGGAYLLWLLARPAAR